MSKKGFDDFKKKPKKSFPIIYIAVVVVIAVIGLSMYLGAIGLEIIPEDQIPAIRGQEVEIFDCEKWLDEGKFLLNKNFMTQDITLWSEEDREKFIEVETQYASNCVVTKEIIEDLTDCTVMFIRIQELIDKMESRKLSSLSFAEQREYDDTYNEYFNKRCDLIEKQIRISDDFMDFDKNRVIKSPLEVCQNKEAEIEGWKVRLGIVKIGEFPEDITQEELILWNDLEEEFEELDCDLILYPKDYN